MSLAAYVLTIESIEERVTDARELVDYMVKLDVAEEISVFPAIYWKDENSIIDFLTRHPEHTFSEKNLSQCLMGQLATTLSHISIWRQLLNSSHEGALVFEDDMYISDTQRFTDIVTELKQKPELEWVRIHLHKKYRDEALRLKGVGLFADDPMPWGFATYYISRAGAKKLLGQCYNMGQPIDWLPPLMKQHGFLDSKTVTEVVVEHHDFEGDESELEGRDEIECKEDKLQKSPSTVWTSPLLAENVRLYTFVSRLTKMRQLKTEGITVLRGVFDQDEVVKARELVLENRNLFKNTRPTPSAGHLAGFHRFPALESLHVRPAGNPVIGSFFQLFFESAGFRTIGLSDIDPPPISWSTLMMSKTEDRKWESNDTNRKKSS
ncbi:hypothetical protein BOW28_11735, partial [Solemya velum gill symbiont]